MTHSRHLFRAVALLLTASAGSVAAPAPKAPPLDIGVSGSAGQILQPDPKLPGRFLWKMYVRGATGAAQGGGFLGTLTGVTALLYQHGLLSARMYAPTATGNSAQQVIVATGPGRVRVVSVTQPGTTLEADKMTWYARKNTIIATGNVVYHNGRTGLTMRVPGSMNADTVLKSVSFGKGTASLP